MRTRKFYIALGSAIVIVCVIVLGLAAYGFVVDLATSPIAINIANAYENSVDLQHNIESAYPAESVIIRYENIPYRQFLTVTLVNSFANQLTAEEQRTQATEIARLAFQDNKANAMVRFIRITFIRRTRFLGIPLCQGDSFIFRRADLLQE
jgi:hypothetical protein